MRDFWLPIVGAESADLYAAPAGDPGLMADATLPPKMALSPRHAAEALDISQTTLRQLMRTGHLRYSRFQGNVRIRVEHLVDFLDQTEEQPGAEAARILALVDQGRAGVEQP